MTEDTWFILVPAIVGVTAIYLLVLVINPTTSQAPVSIHTEGVVAKTVKMGEKLSVQFTADRKRDCPATVVHSFSQLGTEGVTNQIVTSYPVIETTPGVYRRNLLIDLPGLVTPGKWRYSMVLDSDCEGSRIVDKVVTADIDVLPK